MKSVRLVLAGLAVLLMAGCGSATPPPLTLSCRIHHLASGAIRARITVTNTTSFRQHGIVYGPAIDWLNHIAPVLRLTQVTVTMPHGQQSLTGYILPRLGPRKLTHLLMRFKVPHRARPLLVTTVRMVDAKNAAALDNPRCEIR